MKAFILIAVLSLAAAAEPAPGRRVQWPPFPQPARLTFIDSYNGVPPASPVAGWARFVRFLLGITGMGPAAPKALSHPTGLFVRGRVLYVADPGAHGILRYDEVERKSAWLPTGWRTRLASPIAVAAAADGRVFVADSELESVLILGADGAEIGRLHGDPRGLGRPAGLALDGDRLFVSDVRNHRISVYDLRGAYIREFGHRGTAAGEFNFPTYLWVDASRRLWVCDSGNFRLQSFDETGRAAGSIGENGDRPGFLARPRGIALDSDGDVYSVDGAFEAVQILDKKGRLLLFAGHEGSAPGEFSLPGGIFIDVDDRVFVADTYNGRVQVFQYRKAGGR